MLVGREVERAVIGELLDSARAGRGGALVLRGEPGIGKSALCRYALDQAAGMRRIHARGVQSEADLAFAGLSELLGALSEHVDALPPVQAAALSDALGRSEGAPVGRFAVLAGTLSLLSTVAEDGPLLAVIDDVQWLDPASADALTFAARRLEDAGVALIFAVRSGEGGQHPVERAGLEIRDLHGLDEERAGALLAELAEADPAPGVVRGLVRATQGNPLALHEATRLLSADQLAGRAALPEPLPLSDLLADAFARRTAALEPDAQRALLVAAASGDERMAAVVSGLGALGLSPESLRAAEDAGLVSIADGRLEFLHPLARSAAYQSGLPAERRRVHAALAEGLRDDPERRAWHLAAAAVVPDEAVAGELEEAGRAARRRGAHLTAARTLERAAQLTADPDGRARRRLKAAADAQFGGQAPWAIELLDHALVDAQDPVVRAKAIHARAGLEVFAGSTARGRDLLRREAEGLTERDPRRAVLMLLTGAEIHLICGELPAAHATALRASELAGSLEGTVAGLPGALAGTLQMMRGSPPPDERLGAALPRLMTAPDLPPSAWLLLHFAGMDLVYSERYDDARALLTSMIDGLRAASVIGALPVPLMVLAEVHFRTGAWSDAHAAVTEASALAAHTNELSFQAWSLGTAARLEAARGRERECRRCVRDALELGRRFDLSPIFSQAHAAQGFAALGVGALAEAIDSLEQAGRRIDRDGVGHPGVLLWGPDLIEAYFRAGRAGDAERLLKRFTAGAEATDCTWARAAAARCRIMLADGEGAEVAYAEALRWHALTPTPFEAARTHLVYGEHLRRLGRKTPARAALVSAIDSFERLGAEPWSARARDELGTGRTRVTPASDGRSLLADSLTDRELQVALVVGRGATNQEAAARLFLSPKTIAAHLQRIYRKLDIHRRSELARLVGAEESRASGEPPPRASGPT
jgi:DNA-binding CsgD family transcriptional regulator